jgi:hypothetical protein
MTLSLRRSEDFDGDFDLQYRWYLKHADATWRNVTWMLCGQRCDCWQRNRNWDSAGDFVIPHLKTCARFAPFHRINST